MILIHNTTRLEKHMFNIPKRPYFNPSVLQLTHQTYIVEELEVEEINIQPLLAQPRHIIHTRRNKSISRLRQFADNIALAILRGDITEYDVRNNISDTMYTSILIAMDRFQEINELWLTKSPLHGVAEYLDKEKFTFSSTTNDAQFITGR